ncbi:MAG: peptidyl-tRNA hydrolase Pth2 [Candidatus Nanohaloarchaea archaeon]
MVYKQVIVLDEGLEMSKGKMIAQACHASLKAYKKAETDSVEQWERSGSKKVALKLGGRSLEDLYTQARNKKISAAMVKDAGETELKPGTKTALAIGPAEESKIDEITGELELIK